jgi:nitrate/nitrite transporter NarK
VSAARWRYWDVLALVAGAVPIFLAVIASANDLHYGGSAIFVGSAGASFALAALLSVVVFPMSAAMGWRPGNRWLIAAGGVLLLLSAAPSLLLLAGCARGDCI